MSECSLDLIGLTETKLKPDKYTALSEASSPDLVYLHIPHASKKCGGVAISQKMPGICVCVCVYLCEWDLRAVSFQRLSRETGILKSSYFAGVFFYTPTECSAAIYVVWIRTMNRAGFAAKQYFA